MLDSKQLGAQVGVSERYAQILTKKALEQGKTLIECKGQRFSFQQVPGIGGRGKVYAYTPITIHTKSCVKPLRKVKSTKALNPNLLPPVVNLNKPTTDEKVVLIRFYNTSDYPLGLIVNALIIQHGANIKPDSLKTKIRRWGTVFKEQGRDGLEDKRGGKDFKADLQLVRETILGAGSRNYHSLYLVYCHFYAQRNNQTLDYINPTADISESAFNRSVQYLRNTDEQINSFLQIGQDAFRYAQPSFHNVWKYPNQQWEVDATPLDLMVKIPLDANGNKDFYSRNKSADYVVVNLAEQSNTNARTTLVRVMDNLTKASVHMVTESSNSNANARLLYKAFAKLGMPETVRSDQGSDYISAHLQSLLETLGINSIILPPASGDRKGTIERSFRTLQHSALFETLPGFIGHNVNQRQHLENEASTKRDKKSNVATNIKGDFLWYWEAEQWIENYLNKVDQTKYTEHQGLQPDQAQLADIFRRLGKSYSRKVSKNGIRHNKQYYLDNELWAKHLNIGDKVIIHENMDDTTQVFVFKNGEYLGHATAQNIFMQSQTVEQSKATQKAYKKRVVAETKAQMHHAQKQFKGLQNQVRDQFLHDEVQANQAQHQDQNKAQVNGFDPLKEKMRLLSGGRA